MRVLSDPIALLLAFGAIVAHEPSLAQQPTASNLIASIRTLESEGRARPKEAADALERLLPSTSPFSAQRLELLTVQGTVLASSAFHADSETPAAALAQWGRQPGVSSAPSAAAAALLIRARALAQTGARDNIRRADQLMQDAMAMLPRAMAPRDRWRFVSVHGYIKVELDALDEAVRLYHEAQTLADRQDEPWIRSTTRLMLARGYFYAHQIERAQALNLETLALAQKAGDWVTMAEAHNHNSFIQDTLGDHAGERKSTELAIESARRAGSTTHEVRYMGNMADTLLKAGDYKAALAQAEQVRSLARALKNSGIETTALVNMGLAHIGLGHLELGTHHVREAIARYEQRGAATDVSDIRRELGDALEKAGDTKGAIAAYHQHRKLASSILREDQQNAILAMQEQYDADQRERALVLLNRQNQIKAEQLRSDALHLRLWGLVVAAFVLFFAVVALLYRRTRRMNQLLSGNNAQLKIQGERDPLTGLANRRHFQAVVRQWASDGNLEGAAYLMDIDHFKLINDTHGHSAGDAVLVEVARRLRETLREQDLIVRWGGEEFLVLVRAALADQVDALAQRMLSALEEVPVSVDGTPIPITGSIGFATFPIGPNRLGVPWERAVQLVDAAMYLAKAQGRNRAYGVRFSHACDAATLHAVTQSFEAAWREGRVSLTQLLGRTPLAQST